METDPEKMFHVDSGGNNGTGSGRTTSAEGTLIHHLRSHGGMSGGSRIFNESSGPGAFASTSQIRIMNNNNNIVSSGTASSPIQQLQQQRPSRICPSPISSIVGTALNQLNLKRSSSAPMINQLGTTVDPLPRNSGVPPASTAVPVVGLTASGSTGGIGAVKEQSDVDASSLASSFLASLNNSGPRPRRFSASFSPVSLSCPGSPGPAPNRVSQLRQENTGDWESASEKDFHGTVNIAQSWEDLSLESMSMEVASRRPSISDQLWLSMPATSSASASASSSPAASPRVLSRFSPSLSSPSPTRKSFTTRRSLSPIAVRPSVLSIGQGVKRKCDWDSGSTPMDCSPQPAKRAGGLLSFQNTSSMSSGSSSSHNSSQLYNQNSSSSVSMITNQEDSPNSIETESSVSSNGGENSPFFRPLDSPITVTTSPEDSPHPSHPKL